MTLPGQTSRSASRTATAKRPHFVYRCYDADGLLLYVGCTYNVERRMSAHRRDPRTVASHVLNSRSVRVEVEGPFAGRPEALAAESAAIRTESPILNMQQGGHPMASRWQLIARYLDQVGVPLKSAGLRRCSACSGAAPKYELTSGRCPDCAYMHRRGLKWDEVPA